MTATANGARTPPANLEAEEAVLGCCLRGSDALVWAVDHLQVDQFSRPAHRAVFAVLAELHRDGQPVDAKTLAAALAERGGLPDVGGAPFLARLYDEAPTPANVGWFGRKVAATARLRRLIDAGLAITRLGYGDDPDQALAQAQSLLADLDPAEGPRLAGPGEILHAMLEAREAADRGRRVTWSLTELDRITGGLPPRQLIVLGARPAQGKSSLALQVALEAAAGHRALFGSWEMGLSEIGQHHLAALGGVTVGDALWDIAGDRLAIARRDYQQRGLLVLDGRPDLEQFCSQVRSVHARQPLDLVAVDYLQLVQTSVRYERRDLELGAMSARLKDLAVDCDLPVLVLSSLTRESAGQTPAMKNLRDSGQIEHAADQVILLAEQPPDSEVERLQREAEEWRVVDVIVDKNRMGKRGRVSVRFDESRTVFSDLTS